MHGVFRWAALLPIKLLAMLLAYPVAPFAALYSIAVGADRLTGLFAWMQTADNSLDALWQQDQHLSEYKHLKKYTQSDFDERALLRWWARTLWLVRNPAAGLSNQWGYDSAGQAVNVLAQRGVWDSGKTNWLVRVWPGAFQVQAQLFYTNHRFLRLNLGWKSVSGRVWLIFTNHVNPVRVWRSVNTV